MVLGLALAASLAAAEPAAEPAAVSEPTPETETVRIRRVSATLLGGAIGAAAPLLIGWALQKKTPCPSSFFFGCADPTMAFAGSFLPFTAAAGLATAQAATGGRGGLGFGLFGALSGYMTGVAMLGLVSVVGGRDWADRGGAAGAGLLFGLALTGAVTAYELRHSELEAGATQWSLGRSFAAGAAWAVPAGLVEIGVVGLTAAASGGFDPGPAIAVFTVGTLANLFFGWLAAWGVHHALDGKGTWWSAVVGGLVGAAVASGFVALHAHAPPAGGIFNGRGPTEASAAPVAIVAGMIALSGPSVGLEWSNARAKPGDEPAPQPYEPQVNLGIGPTNGGAAIGFSGRF